MLRGEACAIVLLPGGFNGDEFDAALSVAHVPKIGCAPLELSLCPRHPDSVVMNVIGGKIVGDQASCRRVDRMQITSAPIGFLNIGSRELSRFRLVAQHLLIAGGEHALLANALGGAGGLRRAAFGRTETSQ